MDKHPPSLAAAMAACSLMGFVVDAAPDEAGGPAIAKEGVGKVGAVKVGAVKQGVGRAAGLA